MSKHSNCKPWERQKGESVQAFGAFSIYLEMGAERSLRAVCQKCTKSIPLIKRWSSIHEWVERAAAYDAELHRKAYAAAVRRNRKMIDRNIRTALQMQEKALLALEGLDPADLSPKDILVMLRDAMKLEWESRSALVAALEESIERYEDSSESGLVEDVVIYLPDDGRGGPG